jgi:hypothetical protein
MKIFEDRSDIEHLKELYLLHGGKWAKGNLCGLRNSFGTPNQWNCTLIFATDKKIIAGVGTTIPGKNATESKPAEHLGIGFHKDLWKKPEYGTKFGMDVFKQVGTIYGFYDKNKNYVYDPSDATFEDKGPEIGCWMHSTKKTNLKYVDNSSWLCQVWKHYKEFEQITREALATKQQIFSYLLMLLSNDNMMFHVTE